MTKTPKGTNTPAIVRKSDPSRPKPVDLERELHSVPAHKVPTPGGIGQDAVDAARKLSTAPIDQKPT